ncbi:mobilization protein, partial [Campylobacter jejuni]|nr:mobilization protein [Campylobacter jejuni]
MNDLENLSKHFQEKYGFQCYQIAIHRDEGHINEQGEKIINHHAHMEFVTLDKETGKNNFRREKIT